MEISKVRNIINKKVKGKIIAEHSVFGHFYKFAKSGNKIASVTTMNILEKPHLVPWAVKLGIEWLEQDDRFSKLKTDERASMIQGAQQAHTDNRDNAGTIGGIAHKAIEDFEGVWMDTGIKPQDIREFIPQGADYRVHGAVRSAEAAFAKYNVVPVAAELLVGIDGIGAGTLDLIVMNSSGELELWDHKTSNQIDLFYAAQTSAYKKFFEKMTGLKVARIRILKLDKFSNKFHMYNVIDIEKSYDLFKFCSKIYPILKEGKDALIKEDKVIVTI